jgi:hypothetical protein
MNWIHSLLFGKNAAGWRQANTGPTLPVVLLRYPRNRQLSPRVRMFINWIGTLERHTSTAPPSARRDVISRRGRRCCAQGGTV